MFASSHDENSDWLLYSGGWLVGRVHKPGGGHDDLFSWSLTGPHGPVITMRGDAATIEEAKERLITALRSWAAWAGVRRDGPDEPRWVRTSEHQPRIFGPTYEDETDCCYCRAASWSVACIGHATVPATIRTGHSPVLRRRKLRLKSKAGRTASRMGRRSCSARGARGCDGPNCRCPKRQPHDATKQGAARCLWQPLSRRSRPCLRDSDMPLSRALACLSLVIDAAFTSPIANQSRPIDIPIIVEPLRGQSANPGPDGSCPRCPRYAQWVYRPLHDPQPHPRCEAAPGGGIGDQRSSAG
jgi:hypothetical protein